MADEVTFRDLLDACGCATPAEAAECIADKIGLNELQRGVLWTVLVNACRIVARNDTRRTERVAIAAGKGEAPEDEEADPTEYLRRTFTVDGQHFVWGEATVDQHQAYIDMLARIRGGIDRTIALHEDAIARIRAAGVSCLNEIVGVTA